MLIRNMYILWHIICNYPENLSTWLATAGATQSLEKSCAAELCDPNRVCHDGWELQWSWEDWSQMLQTGSGQMLFLRKCPQVPDFCHFVWVGTCCHNYHTFAIRCNSLRHFPMKHDMGNCITSVMTPFVLTPSGSRQNCSADGLQQYYPKQHDCLCLQSFD